MKSQSLDSFGARMPLLVGDRTYDIFSIEKVAQTHPSVRRLPFVLKILLENLLRNEDGASVDATQIDALINWDPQAEPTTEIAFTPARVLLQDFTGVPAVVDLAAMRDAMAELGGDPSRINPILPSELVIDHSVQVDTFGTPNAFRINADKEYSRNQERYAFLRWGQTAFDNFKVVPPDTGIVHQVNVEYLARVVFDADGVAYPDTAVGTDSHTPMVNGLGVLAWGVGGIEAEAAMLGQAIPLLIPQVIGFKLSGSLPEGATATDLVLTVAQILRAKGVVGKFVEFYGPGIASLPTADRTTLGNMTPEYGATCAISPIDDKTLDYLRFTGRGEQRVALVEAYARAQGMFHDDATEDPIYTDTVELDLATVVPSMAGPTLPHFRISLSEAKQKFAEALGEHDAAAAQVTLDPLEQGGQPASFELDNGSVVIAAITSCTNTSNPSVMVGAGLVAKKAVERGLTRKPWVKTSLAPGSLVVTEYLEAAGLIKPLEALGFHVVGYGCTTCIGNSGPLPAPVHDAIQSNDLFVCSVLSGNRNYEGRVHALTRANYLASPPLVVAYALAGRMDLDVTTEPLGQDSDGNDVFLKDIWPTQQEVDDTIATALRPEMFTDKYATIFEGEERWRNLPVPTGDRFDWADSSTYIRQPTFFQNMPVEPPAMTDITGARVLALLGDSVTTDHISPAGSFTPETPAGTYLTERDVAPASFNSYGSRRGNHEVMMRGSFANIRLRNHLAPGTEGGFTRHMPSGEQMTIYDASVAYQQTNVPLLVLAGKAYGSGSSRDWAAKGTLMLGVRAVIAESYERIHRSNLIGMGVLPLQFQPGQSAEGLGLSGEESFDLTGIADGMTPGEAVQVTATASDGSQTCFEAHSRIDTPVELEYYRHGGILRYVIRQLLHS